jgi:leader peptidase (prepilin peptidase)/N-methyltransferase
VTVLVAAGSGLLGLLVGSFLNVVIHRVPRKESVISPRSRCPGCGTQLAERDNIPVISWLALRGRCRTCGAPIAVRYPLVEALTAVLFAVVGAHFGADGAVPAYLVLVAALVAVSAIDLEHFIVPNRILLVAMILGGPLLLAAAATDHEWRDARNAVVGGLLGFGALFLVHVASPRGMGMGDVKLAGVNGLFLGFLGLGHVWLGLFLGFVLGSVIGVALIATGVRTRRDHIPFAPFLAAGAFLTVLFGSSMLDWYR